MRNNYPVVFFVFKRPATTVRFLDIMHDSGIKKIYIFADGPRNKVEKFETDAVRDNIEKFIADNPGIKIITSFAKENLGLKVNIIRGLGEVFKIEDAAIILEDDCLPTRDFFRFTTEMLTRYKDEPKIMSINGTSVGGQYDASYAFTKYPQCWGWATWKRAWDLYDSKLSQFTDAKWDSIAPPLWSNVILKNYWYYMFKIVKDGWISTWDFQWSFAHFIHCGLAIAPAHNLIKNIGFDAAATNTKTKTRVAGMSSHELEWPLRHPSDIVENLSVSGQIEKHFYYNPVAILGLLRQYVYWTWSKYGHRD